MDFIVTQLYLAIPTHSLWGRPQYVHVQSIDLQKSIGTILHRGTCEVLGQVANTGQRTA